ncbi:hypothetical protein TRVL_02898 [Trypanosoma vivax]|nr:hypothetical protein TRVL_02898 [Trypanosoma vivax]
MSLMRPAPRLKRTLASGAWVDEPTAMWSHSVDEHMACLKPMLVIFPSVRCWLHQQQLFLTLVYAPPSPLLPLHSAPHTLATPSVPLVMVSNKHFSSFHYIRFTLHESQR